MLRDKAQEKLCEREQDSPSFNLVCMDRHFFSRSPLAYASKTYRSHTSVSIGIWESAAWASRPRAGSRGPRPDVRDGVVL